MGLSVYTKAKVVLTGSSGRLVGCYGAYLGEFSPIDPGRYPKTAYTIP